MTRKWKAVGGTESDQEMEGEEAETPPVPHARKEAGSDAAVKIANAGRRAFCLLCFLIN